jgi:hypothetical protein
MESRLPSSLVVLTFVAAGFAATRFVCSGCVDRNRRNTGCEWTDDKIFSIETGNASHWRHLVLDAQLAEELAVEYADAHFYRWAVAGKRVATFDTHAANVRAQGVCLAQLDVAIGNAHRVTAEQIAAARRVRNPVFDLLVLLLFVPLYGLVAKKVCDVFRNVLFTDARFVRLFALVLTSASTSGLGLWSFVLWRLPMEGMRVGNPEGHMGHREAGYYWSPEYAVVLFVGGMLLFWVVAILAWRKESGTDRVQSPPLLPTLFG